MGPDFDLGDGFVEEMLDGVVIEEVRLLGVLRRAAARHFLVIFVLSPLGFGAVFGVLRFGFLSVSASETNRSRTRPQAFLPSFYFLFRNKKCTRECYLQSQ